MEKCIYSYRLIRRLVTAAMHNGGENVLEYILTLVAGLASGAGGDLFIRDEDEVRAEEGEERGQFYRVMQVCNWFL
jgi:triphosphoribosyl-dephospho-CoA synthetase